MVTHRKRAGNSKSRSGARDRRYEIALYRAVADPTRRAILDHLMRRPLEAGAIARKFPVSRPAISRHLRLLRRAALVREQRLGRRRIYHADPAPLRQIDEWLARYRLFWSARLIDLKEFVESNRGRQ